MSKKETAQEKLQKWIEKNPEGYLQKSYEAIGNEIGITSMTVWRNLPKLIAKREGCLPSDIVEKRKEHGLQFGSNILSTEQIQKIKELGKKNPPIDIAFIMKIDIRTVKKYLGQLEKKSDTTKQG